ncbi:hypothetical protein ACSBOB_04240 [Mesorhizobium sp. ASY16-5R]|uniref:hypothetical protein n=1 Tax=Mesorhizobium sp. ASY16-5R TaxID=3445772 RepID=UPI003FA10B35
MAREIGNPLVGGMILMSAFATTTGLVTTEQLLAAMRSLVPPCRASIWRQTSRLSAPELVPSSH